MYEYINESERNALRHLQNCMARYEFDSQEYNLARRAYGFICNKIRVKQKTDTENLDGVVRA